MVNKVSLAKGFLKAALPVLTLLAIGLVWQPFTAKSVAAQAREVRVVNTIGVSGSNVSFPIELVAQGNENALGFSLSFDSTVFSSPTAVLGAGASGASLNVNTLQAANGRLGLALAMPTGQTFAAGIRQLVVVTFTIAGNAAAGQSAITFGNLPIAQEVSDANANVLTTLFTAGAITVQQPNPVPALTSLNPTSATAGTNGLTLTVNGSNFVALSTVRWNGVVRTTQFVSSTQLTATIPASDLVTAGTAALDVVNPSPGGGNSNSLTFTINNPLPAITSLSPNSVTVGSAAITLTINGTGFVPTSTVWWNGSPRTAQYVSATQLTASIPASDLASAGTASVVINNPAPGGGSSVAATFTINNPVPAITSLSPTSATSGGAAFTLTINGSGFVSSSTVWWNGAQRTAQFVSATQLTASILASDIANSGSASVVVQNPAPGGGSSPAATFGIGNPPPAITSLSPNSAIAGGAALTLTINGTGFLNTSTVWWNGAQRTTQFVSSTQLTASISASDIALAGTASVVVQNPAPGGGSSPAATFTINNPSPAITSLSPTSATAGGAAFTLTINGTGFVSASTVWWNGTQRATQYVSATQLTASITANDIASRGTASVVVQNPAPGGGSSPAASFTINNPVPTITVLNPASATAGSAAFTLTVNGTNFVNGSTVNWNGSARTTQFVSATQVTASITAADIASVGSANVTVTNPAPGGGTSNQAAFTINANAPAPTTISISPSVGIAGGAAFTLTVNGTNFTGSSTVNWNGNARTTTFVSATQLTAAIPAADIATAGTAAVTVVTPAPGGGTSNAQTFTIVSPVASVSAASFLGAELAPESIVAAFGVNLATSVAIADITPLPTTLAGTKVTVKDSLGVERLAPLFFVAPSQINYQMPPGTASGVATVTVTSGDGKLSVGSQQIALVAAGLFTANVSGEGVPAANVFRLKANGDQSTEDLSRFDSTLGRFVPIPIDLGPAGEQAFGIFYGTGFRNANLANVTAKIGGVTCEVLYAGPTPGYVGLDQFNIRLERPLIGRGDVDVVITVNGKAVNTVRINIK